MSRVGDAGLLRLAALPAASFQTNPGKSRYASSVLYSLAFFKAISLARRPGTIDDRSVSCNFESLGN